MDIFFSLEKLAAMNTLYRNSWLMLTKMFDQESGLSFGEQNEVHTKK